MARKSKTKSRRRKNPKPRSLESAISHAMSHPVRLDAFVATFEAMASPVEVAKLLRKPLGTVSFHMKELRKYGITELVHRVPRRGAVEHFYRATVPPEITEEEWKALSKRSRRKIAAIAIQVIMGDALSALRHKKLENDDDTYLVWMPMRLSKEGQDMITALQAEMLKRIASIHESHAVPENEDDEEIPMRVAAMLWFERGRSGRRRPRDIPGLDNLDDLAIS